MHIGRYQQGDRVPVTLQCRNSAGAATAPAEAPVAVISVSGGAAVATRSMPVQDPAKVVGLFQLDLYLDSSFGSGDYDVLMQATVDGLPYVESRRFAVVAGGYIAGEVQAMKHWQRPEAGELVMQLAGGTLQSGRNPSIPTQEY